MNLRNSFDVSAGKQAARNSIGIDDHKNLPGRSRNQNENTRTSPDADKDPRFMSHIQNPREAFNF